jgi:hypothetical protein
LRDDLKVIETSDTTKYQQKEKKGNITLKERETKGNINGTDQLA